MPFACSLRAGRGNTSHLLPIFPPETPTKEGGVKPWAPLFSPFSRERAVALMSPSGSSQGSGAAAVLHPEGPWSLGPSLPPSSTPRGEPPCATPPPGHCQPALSSRWDPSSAWPLPAQGLRELSVQRQLRLRPDWGAGSSGNQRLPPEEGTTTFSNVGSPTSPGAEKSKPRLWDKGLWGGKEQKTWEAGPCQSRVQIESVLGVQRPTSAWVAFGDTASKRGLSCPGPWGGADRKIQHCPGSLGTRPDQPKGS